MKELKVILLGQRVGTLCQEADGRMTFRYDAAWLEHEKARPLSQSLPLREETFSERECAPFFGGLLPEEQNRELIARNLGITPRNDYAMLREIGGECAGAVSLLPEEESTETTGDSYRPVSETELIELLDQLPQRPLLAGEAEVRLSLAGAQNKIALKLDDTGYSIPKNEAPSTHILKPEVARFPGLAENEAYCLKLAADLGLNVCRAQALQLGAHRCLLVTRYDRVIHGDTVERLHQEDFCQALGIPSRTKYQSEGGPGLPECFELLRRASSSPARDLIQLYNGVLFNFLIGNHGAHGKNFSLLYRMGEGRLSVRLAPFYDLVSTAIYPELTPKMAMKIGKSSHLDTCRLQDWELYWAAIGFSQKQARRQTTEFMEALSAKLSAPASEVEEKVQLIIRERLNLMRNLLS